MATASALEEMQQKRKEAKHLVVGVQGNVLQLMVEHLMACMYTKVPDAEYMYE